MLMKRSLSLSLSLSHSLVLSVHSLALSFSRSLSFSFSSLSLGLSLSLTYTHNKSCDSQHIFDNKLCVNKVTPASLELNLILTFALYLNPDPYVSPHRGRQRSVCLTTSLVGHWLSRLLWEKKQLNKAKHFGSERNFYKSHVPKSPQLLFV